MGCITVVSELVRGPSLIRQGPGFDANYLVVFRRVLAIEEVVECGFVRVEHSLFTREVALVNPKAQPYIMCLPGCVRVFQKISQSSKIR